MADSIQDSERLSYATISPPDRVERALARVAVAERAHDAAECLDLLGALGLGPDAGPRVRLRDLPWRPDHHLKRSPDAPAATAPDSPAVIASRAAAKRRRREAAKTHLRAQGLSGRELRSALARMESS